MIYHCQNAIIDVVGVAHMKWNQGIFQIRARNYSALAFRVKGTATITVNGKDHLVFPNDLLYIPQNVAYAANYSDTEMFVIHFHTAENDLEPEVFSAPNPEQIYRTFLAAHTLWQNKNAGYQAFIISRLYDIFGQICEQKTAETLPAYFLNAVSYINDNFKSSTLSIPDICERTGIGATYLRTLFKKHYNQRPTEYIIGLRLDHARNLIACGVPVKEAAFESGFRDSKYFARVVKQHFHCTPRELELYGK